MQDNIMWKKILSLAAPHMHFFFPHVRTILAISSEDTTFLSSHPGGQLGGLK